MIYRVLDDGKEINTIVADAAFAADYAASTGYTLVLVSEPEPEPVEETPPEPTAADDTDAMLVDHEYRLTLLELGV